MEVFSKSYLEEVVENQGKLFEYAEEHCPGIDVADFIESYMKSYTRAMVDEGQAYVCTMDAETLYNYFLENDKYEPKQGKIGRRICSKLDWTILCIISMDIPTTKQRSR